MHCETGAERVVIGAGAVPEWWVVRGGGGVGGEAIAEDDQGWDDCGEDAEVEGSLGWSDERFVGKPDV